MTEPHAPVRSTGVGSWPGTDLVQALGVAFAECPELPYLPELPARGAHAQLVGRGTAFLAGLFVDLQPAGWRLTDGSGRDHRLAKATLRSDLDVLEEAAQGYAGAFKIAVAGPWTLAAMMERPRGDRVVADSGARRDLTQSLAEGITQTVAEVRRRLPDLTPVLQLDEPLLPSILRGSVRTASGLSRHRAVDELEVGESYSQLVKLLGSPETGAEVWVHSCAAGVPVALLHGAGAAALSLDLDQLGPREWDAIGTAMEGGLVLGAGALPTGSSLSADQVADRVLRAVRALELDPAVAARLVVTTACGLAGAEPAAAVRALQTIRTAAGLVAEQLAD